MGGNLLIAHGGGPTAVINATLYGLIAEAARHQEIGRIYGARYGIEGVLAEDLVDLGRESEAALARLPYTPSSALGSTRRRVSEADYPRFIEIFKKHDIRYFFYNGGNDSMDTCLKVADAAGDYDVRIIGVPKTIDNDLACTDHCPGFGSAARYMAVSTMELAREVRGLPIHVIILEAMGRNAGWLTAAAALGKRYEDDGPHLVYLPERRFNEERFVADVQHWTSRVKGVLVVASEGLLDERGESIANTGLLDGFGHKIPGGVGQALANILIKHGLKSRSEKPGLLGRNSIALQSSVDREEAIRVGAFAVQAAMEGKSGCMVAIKRAGNNPYRSELELVPLARVANVERKLPDQFVNRDGNGIDPSFAQYCLPLLGEPLPEHVTLKGVPVERT